MYKSLYVKSPKISIYRYRLVMGFPPVGMLNSLTLTFLKVSASGNVLALYYGYVY